MEQRSFGDNVYTSKFNIDKADMDQSDLLKNIVELIINLDQEQ